jgi:hypothetical protein
MNGLLVFAGALACGLVWIAIIAPLIANAFGVPNKFAFWRIDRQNQHLPRWQYIWFVGVFGWGTGMFLFNTVWGLLQWRILGDEKGHHGISFILGSLATWLILGMFFGYWSAPKEDGEA